MWRLHWDIWNKDRKTLDKKWTTVDRDQWLINYKFLKLLNPSIGTDVEGCISLRS